MVYAPNMQTTHVIAPNTGAQVNGWVNHAAQQVPALNPGMGGPIHGQQLPNTQFPLNPVAAPTPAPVPVPVAAGGIPTGGAPAGTVAPPAGDPVVPTGGAPVPPVPPVPGTPAPTPVPASPAALHHGASGPFWQTHLANMQQNNPERYARIAPMVQAMMQRRGLNFPAPAAIAPPTPAV